MIRGVYNLIDNGEISRSNLWFLPPKLASTNMSYRKFLVGFWDERQGSALPLIPKSTNFLQEEICQSYNPLLYS